MPIKHPNSPEDLLAQAATMVGLSIGQLAAQYGVPIPHQSSQRKGLVGGLIETTLGLVPNQFAGPDFRNLGIELKTIPLNAKGYPAESTFVTSIPLMTIHRETWETSVCYSKLRSVLWVPIEDDAAIPFAQRRIGQPLLWSPSEEEYRILRADWMMFIDMIRLGYIHDIHAGLGEYLQVRPKAAHSRVMCEVLDMDGSKTHTVPRGFYLRAIFTHHILDLYDKKT
jgi:DNA mismatch repair protein MutH